MNSEDSFDGQILLWGAFWTMMKNRYNLIYKNNDNNHKRAKVILACIRRGSETLSCLIFSLV